MKQLNYWIWLHNCLPQRANIEKLFSVYSCPQEIYEDSREAREATGLFAPSTLRRMGQTAVEESYRQLEVCAREGIDILTPGDPDYPPLLLQTAEYPAVLYAKGDLSVLHRRLPFAIVGTRNPGSRSMHAASAIAEQLSHCNFCICSGGALGIDSAAHLGALSAGAPTIAVLGGGILSSYLPSNKGLRQVIAEQGLLLSETNPMDEPNRGTFPNRNRIIAGLSVGTLVVEAHKKSGSLLTAKDAYSYDREVYAIPGEVTCTAYAGAEELLKDGATRVTCSMDVVAPLLESYPGVIRVPKELLSDLLCDLTTEDHWKPLPSLDAEALQKAELAEKQNAASVAKFHKKPLTDGVTEDARTLYELFQGPPLNIDTLVDQTGWTMSQLLGALTELELLGYLSLRPDRNYILKQDG